MIEGLPYRPEDVPPELRDLYRKVEVLIAKTAPILDELNQGMEKHATCEAMKDGNLQEHEVQNAYMPVINFKQGYSPAVCAFEVRDGGPMDGKRIVTLCVQLADQKTVMPVLQVPDFDMIAGAEYVGTKEIELLLPEDSEGVGWQEIISDTNEEYKNIHGGE